MISKSDILFQATKSIYNFIEKVNPRSTDFKITNRGVWSSECFALCIMCDLFNVETFIESGSYLGQSAFSLSKYFEGKDSFLLMCFDIDLKTELRERLSKCRGQNYTEKGDSLKLIPPLCKNGNTKRGVFIDGPKGWDALKLAEKVINYDQIKFIGIHDTYLPVDENDDHYKFRKHLEDNYQTWSTNDPEFVRLYHYLDNARWMEYLEEEQLGGILPYMKLKYISNQYQAGLLHSYGPTITFIWRK